ncbi:unnamed protein product [Rangifer tarandus platyrhynchus]|uniref:Uncharacterized protein n=2 Tax=Rangifer tarandus platyrhynchus TaxID=3082113 RepID=A0ABN8ZMV8_RANTA|nr:unnamed protein product [Rangifer tarandus platyrhynchus]CAI9707081.1 unnamed protein product [Rangifer tarandus platyrhynchus]
MGGVRRADGPGPRMGVLGEDRAPRCGAGWPGPAPMRMEQPRAAFLLLKGRQRTRLARLCEWAQPCGEAVPFLRDLPAPAAGNAGWAPGATGPRVQASRDSGQALLCPEIPGSSPDAAVLTVTDRPPSPPCASPGKQLVTSNPPSIPVPTVQVRKPARRPQGDRRLRYTFRRPEEHALGSANGPAAAASGQGAWTRVLSLWPISTEAWGPAAQSYRLLPLQSVRVLGGGLHSLAAH